MSTVAIADGNWNEVADALSQRFGKSRGDEQQMLSRIIQANADAAEAAYFGSAVPALPRDMRGGSVVRAFWWGFHVEISHADLPLVLNTADSINTLVGLIGGSIPSPAQPWFKILAPFIAASIQLLRGLDRGRGIYINMSWFAAGLFIPTSV